MDWKSEVILNRLEKWGILASLYFFSLIFLIEVYVK